MSRWNNVPPSVRPLFPGAAPPSANPAQPPPRIPQQFMAAMKRLASGEQSAAKTQPEPKVKVKGKSSGDKWRSSFKPLDGEVENSEDQVTENPEQWDILYNPYSPINSDSEPDLSKADPESPSSNRQDDDLEKERLGAPVSRGPDPTYSEPASRPTERRNPEPESLDRPGFNSISRALEQRACSPDKHLQNSSTQRFPPLYGSPRTNGEERVAGREYRTEIATTVRLSPPRIPRDYQREPPYKNPGVNKAPSPTARHRSKAAMVDKSSITCDLCDIMFANGQELWDHLDSKIHWDTLEHIQQINNYDDIAIAFLQEVLLFKSQQCSQGMEDSALKVLQEKNHMTKVEMFHCAACKVFVPSSEAEVHSHIDSPEHISNAKDFEVQKRHSCLRKAETIMQEFQPQLQLFLEGGSPFDST